MVGGGNLLLVFYFRDIEPDVRGIVQAREVIRGDYLFEACLIKFFVQYMKRRPHPLTNCDNFVCLGSPRQVGIYLSQNIFPEHDCLSKSH